MKFLVLSLDYDATIVQNDVLDPDVRQAIANIRGQGNVVVLVTGRILENLRRVAAICTLSMRLSRKMAP